MRSDSGAFVARPADNIPKGADALECVFLNGEIKRIQTFDEVRATAWPDA